VRLTVPPRIRWNAQVAFDSRSPVVATITASVANLQHGLHMADYVAGAQSATTTVSWPPHDPEQLEFTTAGQMHSEMRATAAMLADGAWTLNGHAIAEGVSANEFSTDLAHCGWCTVMLVALGLPIGTPTAGRYNYAANLDYPVPDPVRESSEVLFYLIDSVGGNGAVWVKIALDACIGTPADQWVLELPDGTFATSTGIVDDQPDDTALLGWADAMGHAIYADLRSVRGSWPILTLLWKLVYVGIYERTH
jgi:hypothetical protein